MLFPYFLFQHQIKSDSMMKKLNLKTIAYNSIRQKIVTCEYAPGIHLNEEILTETLGLSRTPVRDALSRLEQEGLIEIIPKRGIIVRPFSLNDINMIFEVRMLYEPYILLNYGSLLPEARLKEFFQVFQQTTPESEYWHDPDQFYELDGSFHQLIIDACPNLYIQNNYTLIQAQNARLRYMTGNVSEHRLEATFREHMEIAAPCLQKNWEAAAEKLRFHLNESKKAAFQLVFDNIEHTTLQF